MIPTCSACGHMNPFCAVCGPLAAHRGSISICTSDAMPRGVVWRRTEHEIWMHPDDAEVLRKIVPEAGK